MSRLSFIIFFLCLISHCVFADETTCANHQCLAVVDAGSTSSRLHIYSYDLDKTNSPIHINEVWFNKVKPGFATLELSTHTIDSYLSTLFSHTLNTQIPVYFYATGGMRLLPHNKQKEYYQKLQHWFSQHSEWQLLDAKTITGNEEALFDWLAVNYDLGTLNTDHPQNIGVMDFGGASVQIAFPIENNPKLDKLSQIEFNLYGQHFNVYVQSFLGLGHHEMSHQFLNSASCFANNYQLPDSKLGIGNSSACAHEISNLINYVHGVSQTVQPLLANSSIDSWYALGGISNLVDSKIFRFEKNQLTNQDLLDQANTKICQQDWENLNAQFPEEEYLYGYCLFGAAYYALMVDGYGLNPEQSVNYFPSKQHIDWSLAVVLNRPYVPKDLHADNHQDVIP